MEKICDISMILQTIADVLQPEFLPAKIVGLDYRFSLLGLFTQLLENLNKRILIRYSKDVLKIF